MDTRNVLCTSTSQQILQTTFMEKPPFISEEKTLTESVYTKQLQSFGIVATTKHFLGDGATIWETGDSGYKIDQGNVK